MRQVNATLVHGWALVYVEVVAHIIDHTMLHFSRLPRALVQASHRTCPCPHVRIGHLGVGVIVGGSRSNLQTKPSFRRRPCMVREVNSRVNRWPRRLRLDRSRTSTDVLNTHLTIRKPIFEEVSSRSMPEHVPG